MFKQGGMVSDDEHDDAERSATIAKRPTAPQKGGKGKLVSESVRYQFSLYSITLQQNIIKISSVTTSQAVTKKQARGGDARWKLGHLPPGTDKKFTDSVVPLVKLKAGTLAPWAGLNHEQVQNIVDVVFGEGEFVVEDGDVWCGLVSFFLKVIFTT